ncbi:uncharacterized protein ACA1_158970 [Acanthamoeba castellanii str. Neff]|uniref:Uncharacterized protein n=1 Tax=Acanthamoeba castellanii (strain ATCC 30010 / Neff) TaxID=1257118 RepID=L8HCM3_ACACF|nr:uncharacterized protein ACA1_158970 [Acanthamoeba castellanii str. Neff]ELR22101.1 hypothetical protein ACA1_158970 [Acanthamoeba castellanii str. Neff]
MKKVKELDVSDTKARGRGKEEEKKKVVKSARRPKEGDVQLLRELTAGDWAWLRQRVERRGMRVESVEEEEEEEEEVRKYKRKWDQVLTLNEHDQDGENEEDKEGNEDEEQEEEEEDREEEHQEQEYKRRKLNWPEEEEEFLVSDPITKLNPILDRCHITN